jgi:hypothetical protein
MNLTLPLLLVLSTSLPLAAHATDALGPLKNAVPLYEGFKGTPLAAAQKMLGEATGASGVQPKDLVTFSGYDEKLFSAFASLPAKRTQTTDFTACTEVGGQPMHNRKITKGAASALDYTSDGFTDIERAAIEKSDSRVLHYTLIPAENGQSSIGTTQYLDFNNGSTIHPGQSEGINLRIGTLKNPVKPGLVITKCAKLSVDEAVFPDEILREAAATNDPVQMDDKNGMLWSVKKGSGEGKWVIAGPSHLSDTAAIALFQKNLATRTKSGRQPWHISLTDTFKGTTRVQRIQFAKFEYEGGRSEIMTLLVANGKSRLGWSVIDTSERLNPSTAKVPPAPPNNGKMSFEDYVARMSPAGGAALRLMQVAFECPDSAVAKKLDKDLISSLVLYETLGAARPAGAQLQALSQETFQALVIAGVDKLKSIDETDVSTAVNCGVTQAQVDTLRAVLDQKNPDFLQFVKRLETMN